MQTQWNPELMAWLEDEDEAGQHEAGYEEAVFRGLRVRMGMHYDDCQYHRDAVTDRIGMLN
jgi:hypothetical protein